MELDKLLVSSRLPWTGIEKGREIADGQCRR